MIYGLKDPRTDEIRYVGKTQRFSVQRLQEHLRETQKRIQEGNPTSKHEWIEELEELGFEPEIKVLEECSSDDWEIRERAWIAFLPDLLNLTEGGEHGPVGYKPSEETRGKLRAAHLGRVNGPHSEERKEKIRAGNLGKRFSEETKEKMRVAHLGKRPSEETKAKIRASLLKRPHNDD